MKALLLFTASLLMYSSGYAQNVGIGINTPNAKLSISSYETELAGSAASNLLRTNAGILGNLAGDEIGLANFGFASNNNSSLGIRAYRTSPGTGWEKTAILLGMDVDNTVRVGSGFVAIGANGNIGISTATPSFPLSFPPALGDKISLWSNSTNSYGFGVQGSLLQIHTDIFEADIAFGYGSSVDLNENMRIKGNGNVGIGTTNPAFKLDVANGSINTDSVYRIANYTVLATPNLGNLFVGAEAGILNQGFHNTFSGYRTGYSNTSGYSNSFFGRSAGEANTTGIDNSFFGRSAGLANTSGSDNSFFGFSAGSANTSGNHNSFFGVSAGKANTTGNYNSFLGEDAGLSNTTGYWNSFFGSSAGHFNTTGYWNSFFGLSAGRSNITGAANSFFGYLSGYANTDGVNNSFFGEGAGFLNTSGHYNSFFGQDGGHNNLTGNYNSFFGREAGLTNTIGTNNTALGYFTDFGSNGLTNATAIGASAQVDCSNCMVLGSVNGTNNATSDVNVGIGINTPLARLHVFSGSSGNSTPFSPLVIEGNNNTYINLLSPNDKETAILFGKEENAASGGIVYNNTTNLNGLQFRVNGNATKMALYFDGNAWLQGFLTQGSDLRLKKDVQPLQNSLQKITQLNGYQYYWKNESADNGLQTGVIAQEVQQLFPELVKEDKEGMLSVNYSGLIPVLIESVKEQQKQIAELKKLVQELAARK